MTDILKKSPLISEIYSREIPLAFEVRQKNEINDDTPIQEPTLGEMEEDWDVKGYMTVWKYSDVVGDVIDEKAFDDWMKTYESNGMKNDYGKPLPMLFEHSFADPIGYWTKFEKDAMGLMGYAKFYDTQRSADIQKILKDPNNSIGGFSVRFSVQDMDDIEEGGRFKGHLYKAISLKETSLVMRPAQKMAMVTTVKADQSYEGTINLGYVTKTLREAGLEKHKAKAFVSQLRDLIEPPELSNDELALLAEQLKAENEANEVLLALKSISQGT